MLYALKKCFQNGFEGGEALFDVRIDGILLRDVVCNIFEDGCNVGKSWVARRHDGLFSNFSYSCRDSSY